MLRKSSASRNSVIPVSRVILVSSSILYCNCGLSTGDRFCRTPANCNRQFRRTLVTNLSSRIAEWEFQLDFQNPGSSPESGECRSWKSLPAERHNLVSRQIHTFLNIGRNKQDSRLMIASMPSTFEGLTRWETNQCRTIPFSGNGDMRSGELPAAPDAEFIRVQTIELGSARDSGWDRLKQWRSIFRRLSSTAFAPSLLSVSIHTRQQRGPNRRADPAS